jgi:hypothetical protein
VSQRISVTVAPLFLDLLCNIITDRGCPIALSSRSATQSRKCRDLFGSRIHAGPQGRRFGGGLLSPRLRHLVPGIGAKPPPQQIAFVKAGRQNIGKFSEADRDFSRRNAE